MYFIILGSTVAASYDCELEQVRAVNFTRQVQRAFIIVKQ